MMLCPQPRKSWTASTSSPDSSTNRCIVSECYIRLLPLAMAVK